MSRSKWSTMSLIYAYFDRDNVALTVLARLFKESSEEERGHAEKYMEYRVEAIIKISEYVSQLRRVGKGHGVWHFGQMLLNERAAA